MKTIYLATIKRDKVSGCDKYYVGQTSQEFKKRKKQHLDSAKNPRSRNAFYQAIRKYGEENFYIELLEECLASELNEREMYWIAFYNATEKSPLVSIVHSADFLTSKLIEKTTTFD